MIKLRITYADNEKGNTELTKLLEILGQVDEIEILQESASYNAGFDLSFLGNIGFITPRLLCDVMLDFAEIYGVYNDYWESYTWQKLITCANYYNFDWDKLKAHNSLADSLATLYCYESMLGNTDKAEQFQEKFNNM